MGLRLLLASDYYPPFIGGAHRQTQLLAHELQKRGHCVSVATVWHGGLPEEEDESGVCVYRLKQLRTVVPALVRDSRQHHHPPFPDPVVTLRLRRLIEQVEPEVIHAYGWITYSVAVALAGKDIPLLIAPRDYGYTCANRTLLRAGQTCSGPELLKCVRCAGQHYGVPKGWLAALGVRAGMPLVRAKVNGIHNISTYVQEMMGRDFWGRNQTAPDDIVQTVIPSFREDDDESDGKLTQGDLEPFMRQLPLEPFILFVGALRREKGVEPLLAAYQQLHTAVPLVLIGTLERDTPRTFPARVQVLEKFPHPAVMAAWDRSLFGVIPSLWPEPLGSVVYEGMSRGKAVIGTRPGGHTDMIVDQETGFLVPSGNVEALASAMRRLIDQPGLAEDLGRAGRERARQFTARVAVPQFEQLCYRLAARRSEADVVSESRTTDGR